MGCRRRDESGTETELGDGGKSEWSARKRNEQMMDKVSLEDRQCFPMYARNMSFYLVEMKQIKPHATIVRVTEIYWQENKTPKNEK